MIIYILLIIFSSFPEEKPIWTANYQNEAVKGIKINTNHIPNLSFKGRIDILKKNAVGVFQLMFSITRLFIYLLICWVSITLGRRDESVILI